MNFADLVYRQRAFFLTGATRPLDVRREHLQEFSTALERHESSLLAALQADLHKSPFQGYASELGLLQAEIRHALKNLSRWAAPVRCRTPWFAAPSRGWVQSEPFGVACILGPWNYPVQLLLTPLVSAIAAGNCAVLKPSELAPHTAEATAGMVAKSFAENHIAVVTGGADIAEALLRERFDKIFFTGSTRVGSAVMAAAAKQLTPVTLELGGKCPVIVCADAAIEQAAKRIAWGKFMNAGQTCVAPDFVLVQREVGEAFVAALKKSLREFYGEAASRSADYGRIVNARHFERLLRYLREGKVIYGGEHEASDLFLAPTILTEVLPNSPVMQEEIFGPILPVLEFGRLDDALALLRGRPTPLALYLFTRDRATETRVLAEARSGGVCVNDVVSHMVGTGLPFGGLGESGMGAYHGRAGFEAHSYQRAVMRRATWLDTPFRYPPQKLSLAGLRRALRFLLRD
ncbi:MAG: aldehyde dehydrogenase [Verrucomicrobiota bacterium]|jgi:aldehyde dehydrogenase (NAD+)